jgi:CheY-like chemotaxis protein
LADSGEHSLSDLANRFTEMGVAVEVLAGQRCLRGRLRLSPEDFGSLAGPRRYESVTFHSVGQTHIKCVAPLPFFHLPLIALGGCGNAADLEARIRQAWTARERALRNAAGRLRELGIRATAEADAQVLAFPLGLDDAAACARMVDAQRVVLPGRGPLSRLRVAAPAQRFARFDPAWRHASDAEIAITHQLEALRYRLERELPATPPPPGESAPSRPLTPLLVRPSRGGRRVLLVGPQLGRDAGLAHALKQLGYRVRVEFSAHEALQAFQRQSFDLVFADTHLGRSEGVELIPDLQALPGVERVPVVLVDDQPREHQRAAAKSVGAAGYLVHPIDGARIASGLGRILEDRKRRRYARLPWRLSVKLNDDRSAFTTSVGRMGLFVRTELDLALEDLKRCEIALPELGRVLRVETEGVYRLPAVGTRDAGMGLLFRGFDERDEAAWIDYLSELFAASARDEAED